MRTQRNPYGYRWDDRRPPRYPGERTWLWTTFHRSWQGAFPQIQGVYRIECGTHAIVDSGFRPCHTSERVGGLRLRCSLTPQMLLMWDRGFHSFAMAASTRARQAHFLGRVPAHVRLTPLQRLADGSFLCWLRPRKKELLDPAQAPAKELAVAYPQRWEIEIAIDEFDTHQRLAQPPLPARKPRTNPRVAKRKLSNFERQREKHRQWPQPSISFRDAVALPI